MNSHQVARRLIDTARENGAETFEVWSEGERVDENQTTDELIEALHAVDAVALVILNAEGKELVCIMFIASNEEVAISDYTVTEWSARVIDPLI